MLDQAFINFWRTILNFLGLPLGQTGVQLPSPPYRKRLGGQLHGNRLVRLRLRLFGWGERLRLP
jgi:hypothetical protein